MAPSLLLLGGNGFIGEALARKYVAQGYTVHSISRRKSRVALPGIHTYAASLDDMALLDQLIPQCDLIIHTASTCTPGSSANHPSREGEENLLPLLRLIEALTKRPPRPFLFLSSGGTVYGNPHSLQVKEDAPLVPISYHGAAKSSAELFLHAFAQTGYPIAVLRPSNVYGPGQDGPSGFGLIRTVLQHINSDAPMEVWGDGSTLRDYLYIEDLVEAILRVQRQGCTGVFNVGTGVGHSVLEVIACAEAVTERKLSVIQKPARILDVRGIVLDFHKLNKATGWKPSTGLESGIRHTWECLSRR